MDFITSECVTSKIYDATSTLLTTSTEVCYKTLDIYLIYLVDYFFTLTIITAVSIGIYKLFKKKYS